MDLLNDWAESLIVSNKKLENEKVNMKPGLAVTTPVVELIFLTCSFFEQPDEVRFLSVELYDRFVRLHFENLLEEIWNRDRTSPSEKWAFVEKTLSTQTSLRMLSCIQIASKVVFHPKAIKGKDILRYLQADGKSYTLATIKKSEIRVWKTLNFRAYFPTVLTNVEVLLEQMKTYACINQTNVEDRVALFTDVVYLHHHDIFCKLHYFTTGRWDFTPNEKQSFTSVECNLMYRAAAVVALSLTFTPGNADDNVYREVSHFANISSGDIKVLADIIQSIVLVF